MWGPSFGFFGGLGLTGLCLTLWYFMLGEMASGPYPLTNTREDIFFFVFMNVLMLACACFSVWLGWAAASTIWIRFTSERRRQSIKLTRVSHRSHSGLSIINSGNAMIAVPMSHRYTDVTCKEFPGIKFTAHGSQDWQKGDQVHITLWFRDEQLVDYAF